MKFTPSPVELALVSQIMAKADPQKMGILTCDAALKVFHGSKLSPSVLGEIWNISAEGNNGWISRDGLAIAVRLVGWAQKGEKITQALVDRPGPLPTIEGIQVSLSHQNTGILSPTTSTPSTILLPVLTPQDKAQYMGIFRGCKPRNGLLTSEQALDVYRKSKLPMKTLGQIWNLADTQNCHTLDSTDFAIGMHLIKAVMSDQLSSIPTSLPPGLYEQASGNGMGSNESAKSGSTSLPHQHSGPGALQDTAQNQAAPVSSSTSCTVPDQVPNPPSSTLCQRCPELQIRLNSINGALDAVNAECELLKQALDALTLQNKPLPRVTEHDEKRSGVIQPSGNHKSAPYRPSAKSAHVNAVAGLSRPSRAKTWPIPEKVQAKPEVDSSHGNTRHLPKQICHAEQKRGGEYLSKQNYPDVSPHHRNRGPLTPTRSDSTRVSQKQQGDLSQNNHRNAIYQIITPTLPAQKKREVSTSNIRSMFKCGICMEEQPEDCVTQLDSCGHKFCRDCIKDYIGVKLAEHCFPILCPVCMVNKAQGGARACGMITHATVQQSGITEQQYKIWEKLQMAKCSVSLHCRKCKRSFSVDRQDFEGTDTISCPLRGCNHIWCKQCQQNIAPGIKHSCDGLLELDRLAKKSGWKYCPSCKTLIEKVDGCNHMTCKAPGCNTHFCYKCGRTITTSVFQGISAAADAHNRSCRS